MPQVTVTVTQADLEKGLKTSARPVVGPEWLCPVDHALIRAGLTTWRAFGQEIYNTEGKVDRVPLPESVQVEIKRFDSTGKMLDLPLTFVLDIPE